LGIWISWTYLKWDRARAPERHALTGVPLIWSGVLRRSCRWRQHHLNIEKIHGLGKEGMNGLQMRGRWHRSNYSSSSPPAFGWCSSQDFSTITIHSLGQPNLTHAQVKDCVSSSWKRGGCSVPKDPISGVICLCFCFQLLAEKAVLPCVSCHCGCPSKPM
jgi:hypothetical protein